MHYIQPPAANPLPSDEPGQMLIKPSYMLKKLPKMILEHSQNFTYYALHASHYVCIMLQYEQH